MSTQIQITPKSGITIGSTEITSGTDNRVLFQSAGKVSQDSGFNFKASNKTLWNNGKGGIASNNSFGENALGSNTTGATNSAFGYNAGRLVTTGSNNTFVGYGAGGSVLASNFTGNDNTLIGAGAGYYLTSGIQNTFIGNNTGVSITTGSYNTIIGMNGTSFPSGFAQNVVISDGGGAVALWKNSSHFVGFGYAPATDTLGAKVDIKAQGALSTDLALRVRNSANTANLLNVRGDGPVSGIGTDTGNSFAIGGSQGYIGSDSNFTIGALTYGSNFRLNIKGNSDIRYQWTHSNGHNASIGYFGGTDLYLFNYSTSNTSVWNTDAFRIGINSSLTNIQNSSALQVESTSKGFLPPRMTTTQKNAISSPVAGLVVYDTTLNKLCVFTTAWEIITSI